MLDELTTFPNKLNTARPQKDTKQHLDKRSQERKGQSKFEVSSTDEERYCVAVNGTPSHSYGVSLAIWDHISEHTPL